MNLKPLVNDKNLWESFLSEIEEQLKVLYRNMTSCPDKDELLRLQGETRALTKLKNLRKKVNGSE